MTTALIEPSAPAPAPRTSSTAVPGLSFGRILDAEWTKIRTVRSTVWTLTALVVASVGLTTLITGVSVPELGTGAESEPTGGLLTAGLNFGQVAAVVLGVIVASGEYSSGMIRTTLAATPRRGSVVTAKALVLAGLLFVLGTLTTFAGYLLSNAMLNAEGLGWSMSDPGVLRAIVGGGLYLAVLGIFGLATGLLLRHTAGAVTTVLAVLYVLGNLVMLVPGTLGEWLTKLMPAVAGAEITMVESYNPTALEPWTGFGVFVAETAVLLAVAYTLFARRDA